ncbi:MAG: sensor histidine kinase [Flavobacteriales bacterium]
MNIYYRKQIWKIFLLLFAIGIGVLSLWYTNGLVNKLKKQEEEKVQLWAEATKRLAAPETEMNELAFLSQISRKNTTIPLILANDKGKVLSWRNLDSALVAQDSNYLKEQLEEMKLEHAPIKIPVFNQEQLIYYHNSNVLKELTYYPYIQLTVIALFVLIAYLAFSASRNAEQNQVWVGMAKETAHQLGTPLSSLMGWLEYLRSTGLEESTALEIAKDVHRLETVTERFSKIGAKPVLTPAPIKEVVEKSLHYLQSRVSKKIELTIHSEINDETLVPLNQPLFEWVIENIVKNAVDAMEGEGKLDVRISEKNKEIFIDIEDNGKGIPGSDFKRIFRPGFTSKTRGWGLGLSLAKRIIEQYHKGKIFVKNSELGKGTTFRITLKK